MNKIKRKIPIVKFTKSAENVGMNKTGVVRNTAIKETQQSIQTEQYRGPVRKHNTKSMKIVNHFSKTASAGYSSTSTAADIRQAIPTFYHPDFEPSSLILSKSPGIS